MITRKKQTAFIKKMLYTLKRGYGFPVTLHKITDEARDYETGKRVPTIITQKIQRAIILPATLQRVFESDSTPTGFKYGALFDTSLRQVIIDASDLDTFNIEINDYIVWNEKRWQVSQVNELEYQTAYNVLIKAVEGAVRHMIEEVAIETNLLLTQEVV